jgi:hypothetical protein
LISLKVKIAKIPHLRFSQSLFRTGSPGLNALDVLLTPY